MRFLSCEPLLSPLDLGEILSAGGIHWVIVGGESGPNARPSDPAWIRDIRDCCCEYRIPFLFKQWGEWAPLESDPSRLPRTIVQPRSFSTPVARFGKKQAGRQLNGETWEQFPVIAER